MEDLTNFSEQEGEGSYGTRPASTGQNLGIAALITAIVTFVFAVIPCVGLIAIVPAIIAIVLAVAGISQASRSDSPRGVAVAALVIGIVAALISLSQIVVVGKIGHSFQKDWGGNIEKIIDDVQENIINKLENANVNIKIEDGDQKVEISTDINRKDLRKELEQLEGADTMKNDTSGKK